MTGQNFDPGVYDRAVAALDELASEVDSATYDAISSALAAGRAADESADGLYEIYNVAISERNEARGEVGRLRELCRVKGIDPAEVLGAQLG